MKKIIIDTDPGIDDAIALCYALNHPDLQVCALTTIYGNVHTDLATDNAIRLCDLNGKNVPVAHGASQPLHIAPNPVADFVHGKNGFGEIDLPAPSYAPDTRSAAELIVELINQHPNEITLVAVGPLTNLALALEIDSTITQKVQNVVIMGGAFHRAGNVTPFAEANIWNDPHAAQTVFTASWPVVVHGLDVTYQISFASSYLDSLATNTNKVSVFLRDASRFYAEFYKREHQFDGCCPHDLLALSYLTHPEWFTLESGSLDVAVEGESIGQSIIDAAVAGGNKRVAVGVDSEALIEDYGLILSKLG